jgi:hypothetical protein
MKVSTAFAGALVAALVAACAAAAPMSAENADTVARQEVVAGVAVRQDGLAAGTASMEEEVAVRDRYYGHGGGNYGHGGGYHGGHYGGHHNGGGHGKRGYYYRQEAAVGATVRQEGDAADAEEPMEEEVAVRDGYYGGHGGGHYGHGGHYGGYHNDGGHGGGGYGGGYGGGHRRRNNY